MPLERYEVFVEGIRLSYVERKAEPGLEQPPLLLLHGLIATGQTFASLIAKLPPNRRIVALDLPGAGFSDRSMTADVSFGGQARAVRAFMAKVGLHRPVLLGHSHGGAVALQLAVDAPELLRALVLLAPANPFSGEEKLVIAFYLSRLGSRIARVLPHLPAGLHRLAFRQMTGPGARCNPSTLELYRQSGKVPGTVPHLLRLLRSWHADMDTLRARLQQQPIEMPVLLIWGDRDRVVPRRSGEALVQHMAEAEFISLRGVGHLPNEERPAECGALIRTWLTELATSPRYAAWRRAETAFTQSA